MNRVDGDEEETRFQSVEDMRVLARERAQRETEIHGHAMPMAHVFRLGGLIALFVLLVVAVALAWPYVGALFEDGGTDSIVDAVQSAGSVGVLVLLGVQFLQIVVAFIPGEVVQIAAGMIYGPWLGALVVLVGCVASSAFVYLVVHKLGAPFVRSMVSAKHMDRFYAFESEGRLNVVVFVLFLIPGMPKDVFTYVVPLTHMPLRTFLVLSNVARIPGIVVSTYAAASLIEGDIVESLAIFVAAGVVVVMCILGYEKIMEAIERRSGRTGLELRAYEEREGEAADKLSK